jgi:RNA polymerase sigma factor (sigma-70 family)
MSDDAEPTIPRPYVAELGCFFARHDRWLFGHACVRTHGDRELAADLVQDTFEAAARAWHTLRAAPTARQRAWLLGTLAHKEISDFRRRAALSRRQAELQARYQPSETDTAAQALSALAVAKAWEVIKGLPPRQREVAQLRWHDHLTTAEIAERLGVADGTVHAHLHAARRKLVAGLQRYYPLGPADAEGGAS